MVDSYTFSRQNMDFSILPTQDLSPLEMEGEGSLTHYEPLGGLALTSEAVALFKNTGVSTHALQLAVDLPLHTALPEEDHQGSERRTDKPCSSQEGSAVQSNSSGDEEIVLDLDLAEVRPASLSKDYAKYKRPLKHKKLVKGKEMRSSANVIQDIPMSPPSSHSSTSVTPQAAPGLSLVTPGESDFEDTCDDLGSLFSSEFETPTAGNFQMEIDVCGMADRLSRLENSLFALEHSVSLARSSQEHASLPVKVIHDETAQHLIQKMDDVVSTVQSLESTVRPPCQQLQQLHAFLLNLGKVDGSPSSALLRFLLAPSTDQKECP
eukprot:CAMPEP_0177641976 /NCGR_PEP_ID=MMETSP0447-20121125/7346_1 /TAXON_ID=0 /ORGANISM="Stygamoeba regulata, Strain BSH-02190019" /LENGTH=321 /DNA_ID=CAMNT_0019144115 /DNA_START=163 /DNA_END=1124 /DNA_ORIENTATION=-